MASARGPVLFRSDTVIAALVAGCALVLYLITLLPDIGGPEDSPKFQFVGYVLGTAHPPGYPLYVLLTHAFVQLPIRSVAYRANLFSAVMAALACGLAFVIARRIGAGRWLSGCVALALATGAAYWRSAVFAEVYSLAAAIAALTIALLLAWGARQDAKRLLAAVGTFALGLGNHLTIVGLVPAGAWYILVRHRKALTIRLVAASVALVLLGVSQYWFIVIRSRQEAPYLESRAYSFSDLVGIVTAQRFAEKRFAFGPSALITRQIPAVARVVRDEMGTVGVLLLGIGVIAAIRRRDSAGILVAGVAGGLFLMVMEVEGDLAGFITPMMVFLWPLAALGIQEVVDVCPPSSRKVNTRAVLLAGAAALPLAGLLTNYTVSNQSHSKEGPFLRAVYSQLPDNAGIVAEAYWHRMALSYLAFTKETGPDRGIGRVDFSAPAVRAAKASGRRVFAFAGAATYFSADGLQFRRAKLNEPTLSAWLKELPRGSVVVGATAYSAVPIEFLPVDRRRAPALGLPRAFTAFAWTAGTPEARVEIGASATTVAQGNVVATGDPNRAWVEFDGHNVAEVDKGVVLVVLTADGALLRTLEFDAGEPLRVPDDGALYEFDGENPCANVTAETWTDITSVVAAGGWVATLDEYGSAVVETEFERSADLRVSTSTMMDGGPIRNVSLTERADGTKVLLTELVREHSRPAWRLSLAPPPAGARARLQPGSAQVSVRLCANPLVPLFSHATGEAVLRPEFESAPYFGPGWSVPDHTHAGTVRRTDGDRATLFLPLETGYDYRIVLNLEADRGTHVSIAANGVDIGACNPGDGVICEVSLPRTAVSKGVTNVVLWSSNTKPLVFRGARIRRAG